MTDCNTPTIPPYDSHTKVASSPLQYPLHPPSQTHPPYPQGLCARPERRGAPFDCNSFSNDDGINPQRHAQT